MDIKPPPEEPAAKPAATIDEPATGPKSPDAGPASPDSESKGSDEVARPGLGRMFGGNKKTTRELFKTAANAYTVFKPRAGGAAARLLAQENKSNEPDGITGVVPAPSLLRTKTSDSTRTVGSDQNSIQATPTSAVGKGDVPDLKVTSPMSPEQEMPSPLDPAALKTEEKLSNLQQKAAELQQKSKADEEEAARRKVRRTPQQLKYLDRLGIDASLLEGRGLEYEALLEEFWPQDTWHTKSVDTLQAEVRRELSRVQTGSWFDHISSNDEERQAAIKLIDTAIEEVEDLEKLLTYYNVELSVSLKSAWVLEVLTYTGIV